MIETGVNERSVLHGLSCNENSFVLLESVYVLGCTVKLVFLPFIFYFILLIYFTGNRVCECDSFSSFSLVKARERVSCYVIHSIINSNISERGKGRQKAVS